jgi:hypothetical protein
MKSMLVLGLFTVPTAALDVAGLQTRNTIFLMVEAGWTKMAASEINMEDTTLPGQQELMPTKSQRT